MSYSKGIMWLDDCRIPFVNENEMEGVCKSDKEKIHYTKDTTWEKSKIFNYKRTGGDTKGRYTPNLLVCDDMLNDGNVGGSAYCPPTEYQYEPNDSKFNSGARRTKTGIGDKGTNSRYYDLDLWFEKMIERL